MVLHKDSAWKETWSKFKDTNPVMQGVFNMKKNYEDSENVFVAWARVVTDKISDVWGKWSLSTAYHRKDFFSYMDN